MSCKSIIDDVVEARDLADRNAGQVIGTLRPKELAKIDIGIGTTCDYVERLVQKYESMEDPVQAMALSGDLMSDPEATHEGLQATYALFTFYNQVLLVYKNQDKSTPLIRLPGKLNNEVGEFSPDIWQGKAQEVSQALNDYRHDSSEDGQWAEVLSAQDVRRIWDSLRPLIPTSQCIDMANMRRILSGDRSKFAKDTVQMWKHIVRQAAIIPKKEAYKWCMHPGHGSIEAGTDLDQVSILIDDLYGLCWWRPH